MLDPDYPVVGDWMNWSDNTQWEVFFNPATGNLEWQQINPPQNPPVSPPPRRHIQSPIAQAWLSLVGGPIGGAL